ncbi:MAG: LuxR C-terminal-related transcriptional regulator [Gemmatimonadaceae bacterium]
MTQPLRVLLVERSETDAELIKNELQNSGVEAITERVDSEPSFRKAIRDFAPQVVLSEYMLEDFDAHAALAILRAARPTTPLIIVTGWLHGGKTVACIRGGAEDVVLKTNLHRLAASIKAAFSVRQPLERLTTRQVEVLRLVAEGNRTRDIAKQLQLSVKTVESHRGEIMKRLGFHDVVNLVHYALRVGLVDVRE